MVSKQVYISEPITKVLAVGVLFIFIGFIYTQNFFLPQNFGSIFLLILFVPFCISILIALFQCQPKFLLASPIYLFMPGLSPLFTCVFSLSLIPENSNIFIKTIPVVVLIYCIFMTSVEFYLIKWNEIPKKKMKQVFENKNGKIILKKGGQVLDFSPFRSDSSWLFIGKIRTLQKAIIVLYIFYVFYVFASRVTGDEVASIALIFSFLGYLSQPYLLDITVKIRLVIMKQSGKI